ncbi:urate oxidase [Plasmopara halstedii]|uniref:Uricase n=1 Tax=Plasmopara halstedii TaxID=4781 RepID=A0A0N7L5S7_PLAHL|nr:urate oxidase [Plasmopara halstedii]CEG42307.1 urate oxidase [Plasmopara halstedii]|eukprot:XP_024578676.1 urate oxidase [Plasmopara halstedii]
MVVKLLHHEHGKGRVRMLKVTRTPAKHSVFQLEAQVLLEGALAASAYYDGDNSHVLPTDSIKNTVWVLAKKHEFASLEDFGIILAEHFVMKHPEIVSLAKVKLFEMPWERLVLPDSKGVMRPHHHAFVSASPGFSTATVTARKSKYGDPEVTVQGGVDGLKALKTTQSAFVNFLRDEFTTLEDAPDRLVSTCISSTWTYISETTRGDFATKAAVIKNVLLETFAGPADVGVPSPAVQFTLYKMGEAVLEKCSYVKEITISMPNIHNNPIDLSRFGCKNIHPHGEVFLPIDEPHGIISATIVRSTAKL